MRPSAGSNHGSVDELELVVWPEVVVVVVVVLVFSSLRRNGLAREPTLLMTRSVLRVSILPVPFARRSESNSLISYVMDPSVVDLGLRKKTSRQLVFRASGGDSPLGTDPLRSRSRIRVC